MRNNTEKMSTSYRVVFILCICMVFIVLISGVLTNSKTSGFGLWIWGYSAWLIFRRRVADLVSFYKYLLWIQAIAFAIGFGILVSNNDELEKYIDISLVGFLIIGPISIGLSYLMYLYFYNLVNSNLQINSTYKSHVIIEDRFWEKASIEFEKNLNAATWARCYAESDGDDAKAKARYLKNRALYFFELDSKNAVVNLSSINENKHYPKINFIKMIAWSFGVFIVLFGANKISMSNFLNTPNSSFSDSKPYKPIYSKSQVEAQRAPRPMITSCQFEWNKDSNNFDRLNDFAILPSHKTYVIPKIGLDSLVSEKLVLLRRADKDGDLNAAKILANEVQELTITIFYKANISAKSFMDVGVQARLSALCSS